MFSKLATTVTIALVGLSGLHDHVVRAANPKCPDGKKLYCCGFVAPAGPINPPGDPGPIDFSNRLGIDCRPYNGRCNVCEDGFCSSGLMCCKKFDARDRVAFGCNNAPKPE